MNDQRRRVHKLAARIFGQNHCRDAVKSLLGHIRNGRSKICTEKRYCTSQRSPLQRPFATNQKLMNRSLVCNMGCKESSCKRSDGADERDPHVKDREVLPQNRVSSLVPLNDGRPLSGTNQTGGLSLCPVPDCQAASETCATK